MDAGLGLRRLPEFEGVSKSVQEFLQQVSLMASKAKESEKEAAKPAAGAKQSANEAAKKLAERQLDPSTVQGLGSRSCQAL